MKLLITGDRNWVDYEPVLYVLKEFEYSYPTVISGGAHGADTFACLAADELGLPFEEYEADWKQHGRAAVVIRNNLMLDQLEANGGSGDLVVAFHNDLARSRGTKHCVTEALRRKIDVWHVTYRFEIQRNSGEIERSLQVGGS